ncbi:MAG: hypothetical protein R2762_03890 [Bryobacteraceae bacterium]
MKKLQAMMIAMGMLVGASNFALAANDDHKKDHKEDKKDDHKGDHKGDHKEGHK